MCVGVCVCACVCQRAIWRGSVFRSQRSWVFLSLGDCTLPPWHTHTYTTTHTLCPHITLSGQSAACWHLGLNHHLRVRLTKCAVCHTLATFACTLEIRLFSSFAVNHISDMLCKLETFLLKMLRGEEGFKKTDEQMLDSAGSKRTSNCSQLPLITCITSDLPYSLLRGWHTK